ncbi:MAG: DUF4215 domain-containing protein [Candidatus Peribacteraceae bacterium]|nr:DUF4215 domain-containing protein [Candidatus Peribacteraceae bacterium]
MPKTHNPYPAIFTGTLCLIVTVIFGLQMQQWQLPWIESVKAGAPVCGNGEIETGEACDDENTTGGDGCSATCTVESGYSCETSCPATGFADTITYAPRLLWLDDTHVLAVYEETGTQALKAAVGTVSGDSITFASANTIGSSANGSPGLQAVKVDTNTVVIFFSTSAGLPAAMQVLTISGDTVTGSTASDLDNTSMLNLFALEALSTTKVVGLYKDSSVLYSIIGDIQPDKSIVLGTPQASSGGYTSADLAIVSSTQFVVIAHTPSALSINVFTGNVSGNAITYGAPYSFAGEATDSWVTTAVESSKVALVYMYGGQVKARIGTVSGTNFLSNDAVTISTPSNSNPLHIRTIDSGTTYTYLLSWYDTVADSAHSILCSRVAGDTQLDCDSSNSNVTYSLTDLVGVSIAEPDVYGTNDFVFAHTEGAGTWCALVGNADPVHYCRSTCTPTTPILNQLHYQWRDDTTDLNAVGGWGVADEDIPVISGYAPRRLRIEVANTGAAQSAAKEYVLQFGTTSNGTCTDVDDWAAVPDVETEGTFYMKDSTHIDPTSQALTASQLTNGESYTFVNGRGMDTANNGGSIGPIGADGYTEIEYSIQGEAMLPIAQYCFRLIDGNTLESLDTYTRYPRWNVVGMPGGMEGQMHYRWRDDSTDLNTSGGWVAAEDTPADGVLTAGQQYRLRLGVWNIGGAAMESPGAFQIHYASKVTTCGAVSSWTTVPNPGIATTEAFEMVDSAKITNDEQEITSSLLTPPNAFLNGTAYETTNITRYTGLGEGYSGTEIEYSIHVTDAATAGDYCFRVLDILNTEEFVYFTHHAEITLATPAETCGDGAVEGAEECDDGDTDAGDGCSATCTVETGYSCAGEPSVCTVVCGDGLIVGSEACDDSNVTAGDGCSATCTVESGYSCAGEPSVCSFLCGNGTLDGAEACDDDNVTAGDGCSATCTVERGFTCTGTPSSCTTRCGDSIVAGAEECDPPGSATCTDMCLFRTAGGGGGAATTGDTAAQNQQKQDAGAAAGTATPAKQVILCGNGILDPLEECDEGNLNELLPCSSKCKKLFCGDGEISYKIGEECEPESYTEYGETMYRPLPSCSEDPQATFCAPPGSAYKECVLTSIPACKTEGKEKGMEIPFASFEEQAFCGNGRKDDAEQCDFGGLCVGGRYDGALWRDRSAALLCRGQGGMTVSRSGDGCTSQCRFEFCGDGFLLSDEQCDNGSVCAEDHSRACRTSADCDGGTCLYNTEVNPACTKSCMLCAGRYDAMIDLSALPEGDHTLKVKVTNPCDISTLAEAHFSLIIGISAISREGDPIPGLASRPPKELSSFVNGMQPFRVSMTVDKKKYAKGMDTRARVTLIVTDADGHYVPGLTADSFVLALDGRKAVGVSVAETKSIDCTNADGAVRLQRQYLCSPPAP